MGGAGDAWCRAVGPETNHSSISPKPSGETEGKDCAPGPSVGRSERLPTCPHYSCPTLWRSRCPKRPEKRATVREVRGRRDDWAMLRRHTMVDCKPARDADREAQQWRPRRAAGRSPIAPPPSFPNSDGA